MQLRRAGAHSLVPASTCTAGIVAGKHTCGGFKTLQHACVIRLVTDAQALCQAAVSKGVRIGAALQINLWDILRFRDLSTLGFGPLAPTLSSAD